MARTLSTRPMSSSPPAWAWQVSRQNPTNSAPSARCTDSQTRPIRSRVRAIALAPPAVFSISSGTEKSVRSIALNQFSKPTSGSSLALTWPPCTITPAAPISAAAVICCCSSLRLGIRIRLFVVATLITYGACTYSATSASSAAARSAAAPPPYSTFGPFHPCGSPRKNWLSRASRATASATGSTWSTWAPRRGRAVGESDMSVTLLAAGNADGRPPGWDGRPWTSVWCAASGVQHRRERRDVDDDADHPENRGDDADDEGD